MSPFRLVLFAVVPSVGCGGGGDYPYVTYDSPSLPEVEVVVEAPEFVWTGDTSPDPLEIAVPSAASLQPGTVLKVSGVIRPEDPAEKPGGVLVAILKPRKTPGEAVQNVAVKEMVPQDGVWHYEVDLQAPLKSGDYELQLSQIWNTPEKVIFAKGTLSVSK